MKTLLLAALVEFGLPNLPRGQAQAPAPLTFEVASVRVADREPPRRPMPAGGDITGGPGSADPARLTYSWVYMSRILATAFGVANDQIGNRPDWTGQERFDIAANVPPGATKKQVNEMMQNLLKERFHLAFHVERKDFDVYDLVVAKGGLKLKAAAPADGPLPPAPQPGTRARQPILDQDGFPVLLAGRANAQGVTRDGITRLTFRMSSPTELRGMLALTLGGARMVDKTGLTGPYDFKLEFSRTGLRGQAAADAADSASEPGPDLFTALEKQLGLKLEKSTTKLDVIMIDHLDRQPTPN
jgi:uncharacterized protein (TIGR03435 family)